MPHFRSFVLVLATVAAASPGAGYHRYNKRCASKSRAAPSVATVTALDAGVSTAVNNGTITNASAANVTDSAATAGLAAANRLASAVPSAATPTTVAYGDYDGTQQLPTAVANGSAAPSDSAAVSSVNSSSSNTAAPSLPSFNATTGSALDMAQSLKVKQVFAHFMVGIVSTYTQQDWENDIKLAKSYGIDGFALNIGTDDYSQAQLDLGYAAAEAVGGFTVFISFDFNWYKTDQVSSVSTMLGRYVNSAAQYSVDGRAFVSTFIGDGFDWSQVEKSINHALYVVPKWDPTATNAENTGVSGLFSWRAWPGQIDNVPINASLSTADDELYISIAQAQDKVYMAPVSPWFSTHFGKEVSYPKNWLFKSETLWVDRWNQILQLGDKLQFIEIVTWNDYGESHYIGPFDTPHTDDGASKWASGVPHTAMLDVARPYIAAFKAGATTPAVDTEGLVYWYRPHLKTAECDSTDNCGSKPTGWEFVADSVFVAAMTKSGGTVTVTSGSNAAVTKTVAAGIQVIEVPMGAGEQQFKITPTGGSELSGTGNITVSADCWNGIYNFNFASGSVMAAA